MSQTADGDASISTSVRVIMYQMVHDDRSARQRFCSVATEYVVMVAIHQRRSKEASVPAKGTAEWKGDLPSGSGTFTAGDSITGGYTFKSRFEDGPGSNPEQLIAAAHAACFSMALSNILAQAGTPPDSIQTDATVTLRPVDGKPTIAKIELVTVGRVPGLDEAAFIEHANAAKAGCPVSRALAAVPEITLEASLAQ